MEKQLGRTLQLQNYKSLSSLWRQTDKAFHNLLHQFLAVMTHSHSRHLTQSVRSYSSLRQVLDLKHVVRFLTG